MREGKLFVIGVLAIMLFIGSTIYHESVVNQSCPMAISHDVKGKNDKHTWLDTGVIDSGYHVYKCTRCGKTWTGNIRGKK